MHNVGRYSTYITSKDKQTPWAELTDRGDAHQDSDHVRVLPS